MTFPYAKAISLATLFPESLFMAVVNDEPVVATGSDLLDSLTLTDSIGSFRKVS